MKRIFLDIDDTVNVDEFCQKIKDFVGFEVLEKQNNENAPPPANNIKNKQLEEKITAIFISIGIPAHIRGYKYLREAIKLCVSKPSYINSVMKSLYPAVAEIFGETAANVERAIRHAINVAWKKGRIDSLNNLFGVKIYGNNEKPTNSEIIALIADKLRIEGHE